MSLYNIENGTREVMLQLDPIPGSAEGWNQNCDNHPKTEFYRKLAVCSIVCGCSCIGYKALENSLKAEYTNRPNEAKRYAQQAKKTEVPEQKNKQSCDECLLILYFMEQGNKT
ncbi:hypothetical protein ATANTOWER_002010 [Ataeniobius toweri]|uniref:Uncharacterized protein n=1 Tax=Ataeniobius toweri TaxID=208326 RepID=A0ABU7B6B5_9TELE|nr:hypothetical protein [Ataeniobius toweri]